MPMGTPLEVRTAIEVALAPGHLRVVIEYACPCNGGEVLSYVAHLEKYDRLALHLLLERAKSVVDVQIAAHKKVP